VAVLSGDASRGVADLFVAQLALLRPGVTLLDGPDTRVARQVAELRRGDTVVAIDLRRYERWVLATAERAAAAGMVIVALTDSTLSPLARLADVTFVVRAEGAGPFDSHVGTLALVNALAAGAAARLRRSAAARLDAVEAAWRDADALVEP
jgi:DNA-binding MurR/RpiR family transcriptional regulator